MSTTSAPTQPPLPIADTATADAPPQTTTTPAPEQPAAAEPAPPPADAAPPPQAPSTALAVTPAQQTVIPFHPTDVAMMFRLAKFLADSELVPRALQRRPNDVLVVLLKGHDLGLTPMQAISGINVIDGKAEIGALMMVSRIMKSGLCEYWEPIFEECDATHATYETKRRGARRPAKFVYTVEDARAAGLLDKGRDAAARARSPWNTQRATMLRRRCQSSLAREIYPDVCAGLYDHDELREVRELERDIIEAELRHQRTAVEQQPLPDWMEGGVIPAASTEVNAPADPLKARLAQRRAARTDPDPMAPIACATCGTTVVDNRGDICDLCK